MAPPLLLLFAPCAFLLVSAFGGPVPAPAENERQKERAQLLAPDGIPYDNEGSLRIMQMKPLSGNLMANGSFETGRYWPYQWQPTDGLTTFWAEGGTDGARCLRIYTDVLDAQWKAREDQVRAAVESAAREGAGDPQSLPGDPIPPAPDRLPTSPPYYDTVAGVHGVHYRSDYISCLPRAVYRFAIDARTEAEGEPKVFIKGFFDQTVQTRDGPQVIRRDAYQAPIFLDPCDGQWRRYARLLHPWQSKATLGGKPLKPQWLQVQIYAYWKPGNYYFDNVRLDIVGMEETEPAQAPPAARGPAATKPQATPAPPRKPDREPGPPDHPQDTEFPVFNP